MMVLSLMAQAITAIWAAYGSMAIVNTTVEMLTKAPRLALWSLLNEEQKAQFFGMLLGSWFEQMLVGCIAILAFVVVRRLVRRVR